MVDSSSERASESLAPVRGIRTRSSCPQLIPPPLPPDPYSLLSRHASDHVIASGASTRIGFESNPQPLALQLLDEVCVCRGVCGPGIRRAATGA